MISISIEYSLFLSEIKERIRDAQYVALKVVNKELIILYWDIGKKIVEQQEKYGWGKSIVETLASDLQKEYPGIKGFSNANLWRMKTFYLNYKNSEKLAPLVREISWAKNIIIMEKCKEDLERQFYIQIVKRFGWTKKVLLHQIENKSYEKLAVKDEYTFDFLELGEEHSEKELESALIERVQRFLAEIGGYFCYIGNQYRLEIDEKEYFLDLLLYHRKLKCLVAIELKSGEFMPEFAGKMQFYLALLDDRVKLDDENPSIGIIICKSKNRTIVEYALKETKKPIGVSTYKITSRVPKELSKYLPSREEIVKKLEFLEK